jgi:hypothetical protein
MACALATNSLNLCHAGIKKAREAKRLEVALTKNEIAYRGQEHIAREVGRSVHEQSRLIHKGYFGFEPYMGTTDLSSRWISWGGVGPSTKAPGSSMSAPDPSMTAPELSTSRDDF